MAQLIMQKTPHSCWEDGKLFYGIILSHYATCYIVHNLTEIISVIYDQNICILQLYVLAGQCRWVQNRKKHIICVKGAQHSNSCKKNLVGGVQGHWLQLLPTNCLAVIQEYMTVCHCPNQLCKTGTDRGRTWPNSNHHVIRLCVCRIQFNSIKMVNGSLIL